MPGSVVFTFHPEIHLLLQKKYQEAGAAILPFKKWVAERLSQKISFHLPLRRPFRLIDEEEQRLYIKKLREIALHDSLVFDGIDDLALALFKALKDKEIGSDDFLKGIERANLLMPKKKFLISLGRWYEAYLEKNKPPVQPVPIDEEDLYKLAISLYPSETRLLELDKAVVLALKPTSLELKLLHLLEEEGTNVEMISIDSFNPKKVPDIFVVEAESLHLEVESVLKDISFQFESGARECLIYCFQLWPVYRQILSAGCRKYGIPLDSLTILPWEDNTIVLGQMGLVYLLGVSEEKSQGPLDFFLPQEKEHLNHCLKSDLFELPYERKERTRQLLRYLASSSERLKLSYVADPKNKRSPLIEEFLAEYPKASFEKAGYPDEKVGYPEPKAPKSKDSVGGGDVSSFGMTDHDFPLPHVCSVRSLSQYQRCPYGFFLKECLGFYPKTIDPRGQKGLTAAEEGEIYHDILFRFFSGGCLDSLGVCRESFDIFSNKIGHQIPLTQRLKMEKTVSLFLAEEKEWRQISRFKPRYFEHSFEIELKEGIFLHGKIDRVDVDEESKEFIVIDYKTGGDLPSAKEVMAGRDFQLVIYAIAMEELFLRGYRPFQGFCYHVKKAKSKKLFEVLSPPPRSLQDDWEALKKRTLNEVFSIVSEIRKREFAGTPENCYSSCELRAICLTDGQIF